MIETQSTKTQAKGWTLSIDLAPPGLNDNTSDADRLMGRVREHLKTRAVSIDYPILKALPFILRKNDYKITCVVFLHCGTWEIIAVHGRHTPKPIAGIAVDLGTTRVVMRLVDLVTGETLGECSFDNPQIEAGPDVLTRIHYAATDNGLDRLSAGLITAMNTHIEALVIEGGIDSDDIYLMTLAGNTIMTHLFLGLYPGNIIREPYIPVTNTPGVFRADFFGLSVHPNGRLYVFPNIGSYFGGDLISGLVYSGMNQASDVSILVDVGTNAEVVLGNKDWLIACAGAAGPALEGGVSTIGMMAGHGVIDRVYIDPATAEFRYTTIENGKPVGICGSGFIDLAAVLFMSGIMDIRGRLIPGSSEHVKRMDGMAYYEIVSADASGTGEALTISQASLDSLIRSKAAMYTILDTIALTVGISLQDLAAFYVAGTFGSFIDPVSAITIGMLPDIPIDRFKTLGNSSLEGAAMYLLSRDIPDLVDAIRNRITYIELNVDQGFMNRFSGAKFIPHTNRDLFPSVKRR